MSLITLPTPIVYLGVTVPSAYGLPNNTNALLDAEEEFCGWVVRAPHTGTINKIGWNLGQVATPTLTLDIGLETVADAILAPVATTVAGRTLLGANSYGQESFAGAGSTGVRYTALTTPVAVTAGDLMSITIRVSALTSGSVRPTYQVSSLSGIGGNLPYGFLYQGAAWSNISTQALCPFTLQYATDGFVGNPAMPGIMAIGSTENFQQSTNPNRRGCRFSLDFKARVTGFVIPLNPAIDTTFDFYDTDEYTVLEEQTIDKDKRGYSAASGAFVIALATPRILTVDAVYRWAVYPSDAGTNIALIPTLGPDDGAFNPMTAMAGGIACGHKTTFNGTPDSGSHTWTDDDNIRYPFGLLIDQLDDGAGAGGLVQGLRTIPARYQRRRRRAA